MNKSLTEPIEPTINSKEINMNKVKLVKDPKNDGYLVEKDGQQTRCANIAPFPTQDKFGGIQMLFVPCSTSCPKCNIQADGKTLNISCNGTETIFDIQETTKVDKPVVSGIIASA
jgi:hypothetical protein